MERGYDDYKRIIDEHLLDFIPNIDNKSISLYEAMKYSLTAGGKRLRPVLLLAACDFAGGDIREALPYACAVEYIHTYSLIHDDLPAMDNDDLRRGQPTNHKVFGEGMAILAGDALLTDAFSVASFAQLPDPGQMGYAISVLAQCAGSLGMVGGQALDILSQDRILSEQEVTDIQTRKTGALINAACVLGVISAGGSEEQVQAAGMFAGALGLAFQIRDDMLDVIGSREEMGKGVGTDSEKNTFVRLYGLEQCEALVQKYTRFAVSRLDTFEDHDFMAALAESLTDRRS